MLDIGKVKLLRHRDPRGHLIVVDQISKTDKIINLAKSYSFKKSKLTGLWDPANHNIYEAAAEILFIIDEAMRTYVRHGEK